MACVPEQPSRASWHSTSTYSPVRTLRFCTLYCFFVIEHGRRRFCTATALHIRPANASYTNYGTLCRYRYVLFDRDAKFGNEDCASKGEPYRAAAHECPEPMAERNHRTMGRQCSPRDHNIPLNENHLRHLEFEYLAYFHEDRTHLGLASDTPAPRPIEHRPNGMSRIHSQSQAGDFIIIKRRPDRTHEPKDS